MYLYPQSHITLFSKWFSELLCYSSKLVSNLNGQKLYCGYSGLFTLVIPARRWLKQEDHCELQASLGYKVRHCLKFQKKKAPTTASFSYWAKFKPQPCPSLGSEMPGWCIKDIRDRTEMTRVSHAHNEIIQVSPEGSPNDDKPHHSLPSITVPQRCSWMQ